MKTLKAVMLCAVACCAVALPLMALANDAPRLDARYEVAPATDLSVNHLSLAPPTTSAFTVRHQDVPVAPTPGTTWSLAGTYRFTGDTGDNGAVGVYNRWKTFPGFAHSFDLELGAFGGATTVKKVPVAAVLGGLRFGLQQDISLVINGGFQWGSNASGLVLGISASVKF